MSAWQPQDYDQRYQQPATPPQWQAQSYSQEPPSPYHGQPYYPQAGGWQQYPPQAAPPRKRRRVFLWVFLAVQVLFIAWIIGGLASSSGGPSAASQAAQQCANGGWQGLFQSQADCQVHYAHALNEASAAGKGIGVAIIVVFWMIVDVILGVSYGIYRLASRPR